MIKDLFGILATVNVSDKSCDAGEYLDYKSCKCRKRINDKLVEECSDIDGNEMICNGTLNATPLNVYRKMCNSCTVYIVLLAIFFITIPLSI